jgi:hypothetical protein
MKRCYIFIGGERIDVRTPMGFIIHDTPRSEEYCDELSLNSLNNNLILETDGTGVVWREREYKTKIS